MHVLASSLIKVSSLNFQALWAMYKPQIVTVFLHDNNQYIAPIHDSVIGQALVTSLSV